MKTDKNNTQYRKIVVLVASVFIAGLCSIVYELLISTASSYFLGDSVRQFSLTIGIYMASMGMGSFLSRLVKKNIFSFFIKMEILLALSGGISIPVLYAAFAFTNAYTFVMITMIILIGILIGMEIPLLTRLMEKYFPLKINISNVLSVDYLGALIATIIFPFVLLPFIGTFASSLVFGLINMLIGFMILRVFHNKIEKKKRRNLYILSFIITAVLGLTLISSGLLMEKWSQRLYSDRIVYSKQSKYQNIVMTKNKKDIRLYLNGNLQFSAHDEYRYHEALTHLPLGYLDSANNILILGGGDGLAVRELLKYPDISHITVVDLDPEITELAKKNNHLLELNKNSMSSRRVTVLNMDAFKFIESCRDFYDLIISDLPDPNNISLSRLYSREFYTLIKQKLSKGGIFITQSTSPYFAQEAFWCIKETLNSCGYRSVLPYHIYIPSFGDWGFIMASDRLLIPGGFTPPVETRYLDESGIESAFQFSKDIASVDVKVNTLDNPVLLHYYLKGWQHWN